MELEKQQQGQTEQPAADTKKAKNSKGEFEKVENTSAPRKVSRTWEAAMRLKGSLIVNDPAFLL